MDHVHHRGRNYRRGHRQRSSDHLRRKYNYRGVKRAIIFAAFGVFCVYLTLTGFVSIIEFIWSKLTYLT